MLDRTSDLFGNAEEVTEQEGLVRGLPVRFESQIPASIPTPGWQNPEARVDAQDSVERRQRTLKRPPASARRGAANPDHFGVLWEVAPHRSTASPQVKASSLSGVGEHFGRGDHCANLHPICSQGQGQAVQPLLAAATCAYSPARPA
jgi:hypothetical protein